MSPALASVAIPAFNHADYIELTLESVCAQTYPELELILIDDGSTDNTYDVAKRFLEKNRNRFRRVVIEREKNRGVSLNSNACIQACRGEWIHLLGSDDLLKPKKISTTHEHIIKYWSNVELALVHADVDYIDAQGNPIIRRKAKPLAPEGIEPDAYEWIFLQKHFIFNPTITINRKIFLESGGFDPSLPLEDLDCWLRLSTHYPFARVPEVLASYRKHPGNASRQRFKMLAAQIDTYANFLDANPNLLRPETVRENYRDNLHRFWKRIRTKKPWFFPMVIGSQIRNWFFTPSPGDYRKLSSVLKKE